MRVAILGKGKMGRLIFNSLSDNGFDIVGFVNEENCSFLSRESDLIIDFSNASKLPLLCRFLGEKKHVVIVGTTGYSEEDLEIIRSLGESHVVCYSSNYSIGIQVLNRMVEYASSYLMNFDIELVESHHRYKQDAPSGTTLDLIEILKRDRTFKEAYGRCGITGVRSDNEIGVHSLRGGDCTGCHSLYFLGDNEELAITHRSYSREVYVSGVLLAIELLCDKESGFYAFSNLLFNEGVNHGKE